MTNRRQFLGLGLAASVWPVVTPALAGVREDSGIYKVIVDRRAPAAAAAAFAAPMRASGVPSHVTEGDVTGLWYADLALRWREAPVAIAGLTAPDTLFCLEQLAWDHRMRVVFRAERIADAGGRLVRRLEGPERVLRRAARLRERIDARPMNPEGLARLALQTPRVAAAPGKRIRLHLHEPARQEPMPDPWIAWVIGPVHRGRRAA